jgi:hypothetical protein
MLLGQKEYAGGGIHLPSSPKNWGSISSKAGSCSISNGTSSTITQEKQTINKTVHQTLLKV